MKKRILSSLLMATMFVAAIGSFSSCKDYDDDINDVADRVTALESDLKSCQTTCQNKMASLQSSLESLQSQLETAKAELTAAVEKAQAAADAAQTSANAAQSTADAAKQDAANAMAEAQNALSQIVTLEGRIATTEADITTLKEAIELINTTLANKVDKEEFDSTIKTINAKLAAVDEKLATLQNGINDNATAIEAVQEDLKQQKTTLSNYGTRIDALEKLVGNVNVPELKTSFENTIKEINNSISKMETAIKEADDALQQKIDTLATNDGEQDKAIEDLQKRVSTLEGLVDELKKTHTTDITSIQELLDKKVKELQGEDERLAGLINDINKEISNLKDKDSVQQVAIDKIQETIESYENRIKNLEDKVGTNTEDIATLKTQQQALSDRIDSLAKVTATIESDVNVLKAQVSELQQQVNALNVYTKSTLRGLVFDPDLYYWGIEGTSLTTLNYGVWTLKPALNQDGPEQLEENGSFKADGTRMDKAADYTAEAVGEVRETTHNMFPYTAGKSKTMDLVATYHLNPANADIEYALSDWTHKITVVSEEDPFYTKSMSNEATCGLSVASAPWVENGELKVPLAVKDPSKIGKYVKDGDPVTVFAMQVAIPNLADATDTLITSDYATLIAREVTDVRIAHTLNGSQIKGTSIYSANTDTTAHNSHCGICGLSKNHTANHNHLMATVCEANDFYSKLAKDSTKTGFSAQDQCFWNSSIVLNDLVETHFTDVNGNHIEADADFMEKNGLHYVFELTGLWRGDNKTSESSHAAIKHIKNDTTDLYIFQPQRPDYTSETNFTGVGRDFCEDSIFTNKLGQKVTNQSKQQIGRTPVVRVALVNDQNQVIDYGYIMIEITSPEDQPEEVEYTVVEYNGGDKSWTNLAECCPTDTAAYTYENTWAQTEYDIYEAAASLGVSRDKFASIYGRDFKLDANDKAQQYYMDKNGLLVECDDSHKAVGVVEHIDDTQETDDQMTSILRWTVYYSDVVALKNQLVDGKFTTYVKYESNNSAYPDIYIKLTSGKLTTNVLKPEIAKIDWDAIKIKNYWYDWSSNDNTKSSSTKLEMHTNTLSPEDGWAEKASEFDNRFSNVFLGNNLNTSAILGKSEVKHLDTATVKMDLVFDPATFASKEKGGNTNAKWRGNYNGKTVVFTMSVSKDGKTLFASYNNRTDTVATIDAFNYNSMTANEQQIYFHHSEYAEALLNYRAHNDMDDNTLAAYVKAVANFYCLGCNKDTVWQQITPEQDPLVVRFLRPISVASSNFFFKDAAPEPQVQALSDLFTYIDWRNVWNGTTGWGDVGDSTYFKYYDITKIVPVGVENTTDSVRLSSLETTMTNMNQDDAATYVKMSDVSKEVELYYKNDSIYYKNLSSTVQPFDVRIPVAIYYIWGDHTPIYTHLTIHIGSTQGGSARRND